MSSSCLMEWFDQLLFGSSMAVSPPPALKPLILRLEVEGIPWFHMMSHGGLTAFSYQVHGDLNFLLDSLEKQWLEGVPPYPLHLKTKTVTLFWNQLQLLLAQKEQQQLPVLPVPSERDDAILQHLLESSHPGPHAFESAEFWGHVAQKWIHLHRPGTPSPIPDASPHHLKRMQQLYDMHCLARGQVFDPFTLHLVHHSEYVNAVHWQSVKNLEAFMRDRPTHTLTRTIQALLKHTVQQVLHGDPPSVDLNPCPQLEAFLHNIRVIHASVQQVPHDNTPPKVIDVVQRLLALSHRDGLWEKQVPVLPPAHALLGTALLNVTERLRIAEREKRVLWKHFTEHDEEFAVEPPPHTCSPFLYASGKPRASFPEPERQTVPR